MSFRYMLWTLASPSQLIILMVLLGALLLALGRERMGRMLVLAGAAALFVLGVLPSARYLASPLENRFPRPQLPDQVKGIILLAGAERPLESEAHGQPQVGRFGGRHLTTQRLAREHPEAIIVFSGGPMTEPGKGALGTQSAVAAALFRSSGLDGNRMHFDHGSPDTCATPANVRRLVQPQPGETWVVVTSAMHLPRTVACFRAAGWASIVPYPSDYRVRPAGGGPGGPLVALNLSLLDDSAHEWLGLAYYRLAGRTREWFPAP